MARGYLDPTAVRRADLRDDRPHPARAPADHFVVEQRVVEALELCDRGYVLETGRVVLAGARDALLADARVQRAYLGADA